MAAVTAQTLARMRRSMQRALARGFSRAVFATPRADDGSREEEVVDGPGELEPGALVGDLLETWVDRATGAARAGRVKHTYVLDPRHRVLIDARHGAARTREVDDETVRKMMGGKDRFLRPDTDERLLRVLGILSPDGSMNVRHARKYKQINHFIELCRPAWEAALAHRSVTQAEPLRVFDLACGNAYLTFVLARALQRLEIPARIIGVERNEEMVERARARAAELDLPALSFVAAEIDAADLPPAPDMVLALHACDTATDDALTVAVEAGATTVLVAPCCQAELARDLEPHGPHPPALLEHGLLRREYAAVLTDALRAQRLAQAGYQVDVLEFIPSPHTPKNLLLRGRRAPPT